MSIATSRFTVYLLRCADGTVYVGRTKNLRDRLARHEKKQVGIPVSACR